jgi:tetratricopeptide (TPR) repeat protein
MRFGRESRERMAWLVEFLKAWYSSREMFDEAEKLAGLFAELAKAGEKARAAETLDYRQYLADAMDERFKGSATDRLVNDCLDAEETNRARAILRSDGLTQLCTATLRRLAEGGIITAKQFETEDNRRGQLAARLQDNASPEALLGVLDPRVMPLHEIPESWFLRANALHNLGRDEEALENLETHGRFVPEGSREALLQASVLFRLRRFPEVIGVLSRHANELGPNPNAHLLLSLCCAIIGDFNRAVAICKAARERHENLDLRQFPEALVMMRGRGMEPVMQFGLLVLVDAFAEARKIWNEKIRGSFQAAAAAAIFNNLINERNLRFLRTLIRESELDDELLPLAVAMDYLETGDRSPLEKLSAEVRPIAEEIVAEFQKKLSKPDQAMGA